MFFSTRQNQPRNFSVRLLFPALLVAWALFFSTPSLADDIIIRPQDGPAALQQAVESLRRLPGEAPRRLVLESGEYFLEAPLALDSRDNGLAIEAAPGARPVLRGGRRITPWRRDGDHLWRAGAPWPGFFRILVVQGRMADRSRLPEQGFFHHLNNFDVPWLGTTGGGWERPPTREELTTLRFKEEDLGDGAGLAGAEITVFHNWDETLAKVESVDTETHIIRFAIPLGHPAGALGADRYIVWNTSRGLTRPGQWRLDADAGEIVYWPLPGEDMAAIEAVAPVLESIIQIQGSADDPVRGVTIKGLTLSCTTTPMEAGGFGAGRFGGAVSAQHTRDCRLEGLEIENVGGWGVQAEGQRLVVAGCRVRHVGAGGIRVMGRDCQILSNQVHDVGLVYPSAVGIWAGRPGDGGMLVSRNEIQDTPFTALAVFGSDNRVEHNRISRAMEVLDDGAGIYLTFGANNRVTDNILEDITGGGLHLSPALYLDEQATRCTAAENLIIGCPWPVHCHMAPGNTLADNLLISNGDMRISLPKSPETIFRNNTALAQGEIEFRHADAGFSTCGNILFSGAGKISGVPPCK